MMMKVAVCVASVLVAVSGQMNGMNTNNGWNGINNGWNGMNNWNNGMNYGWNSNNNGFNGLNNNGFNWMNNNGFNGMNLNNGGLAMIAGGRTDDPIRASEGIFDDAKKLASMSYSFDVTSAHALVEASGSAALVTSSYDHAMHSRADDPKEAPLVVSNGDDLLLLNKYTR